MRGAGARARVARRARARSPPRSRAARARWRRRRHDGRRRHHARRARSCSPRSARGADVTRRRAATRESRRRGARRAGGCALARHRARSLLLASPARGDRALLRAARRSSACGASRSSARATRRRASCSTRLRVDTTRSVWDPLEPLAARVRSHPQVESVDRDAQAARHARRRRRGATSRWRSSTAPGGLRAVDERGRRLPLDPSQTPVDAPIVTAAPRDTMRVSSARRDAARSAVAVRASSAPSAPPVTDEIVLQIADLSVRAMTNVTLDASAATSIPSSAISRGASCAPPSSISATATR